MDLDPVNVIVTVAVRGSPVVFSEAVNDNVAFPVPVLLHILNHSWPLAATQLLFEIKLNVVSLPSEAYVKKLFRYFSILSSIIETFFEICPYIYL